MIHWLAEGGMNLFVKYLSSVDIYPILEDSFGGVRKNKKEKTGSISWKTDLSFYGLNTTDSNSE